MRKFIIYIMTFVCICSLVLTGCTSNENDVKESTKSQDKAVQAALIKFMDNYVSKNEFSGTILVAKGDDVLLDRGYGMADRDKHIKNNPQTVFEIASNTKQFTATAILMLQEKKLLNVQDKLSKYISDYPNGDKIKIDNLLTHTSGIDEVLNYVPESRKTAYTPVELINLFKNKPLIFDPGTQYSYSNSNYVLLGYIIEKVSGMKYEDYIEKNIIKPLKLKNTGTLSNQTVVKNKATGYYLTPDTNKSNKYKYESQKEYDKYWSVPYAAGEICSTVEDLYRWNKALNEGKLINNKSLKEMFTPHLGGYGYGCFISEIGVNDKTVFHTGRLPGYLSYIMRDINEKYVIIILSNYDGHTPNKNIQDLSQLLLQKLVAKN